MTCLFSECLISYFFPFFFFNDTATTEIYTLSLHDALPISSSGSDPRMKLAAWVMAFFTAWLGLAPALAAAPAKTAQVSLLEGRAQRSRATGGRSELRTGAPLAQGDTIETQDASRLEVRFSDGSVLRLGPRAKLQLTQAHFGGPAP